MLLASLWTFAPIAMAQTPIGVIRPSEDDYVMLEVGRGVIGTVDTMHFAASAKKQIVTIRSRAPIVYSFSAPPGFRNIHVRGGLTDGSGREIPKSGTLAPMNGPRYLSATSDVIVLLQPEGRKLFDLTKAALSAATPAKGYTRVQCERARLARVYGDSLALKLEGDVTYILQAEWPGYWKRFWRARPEMDRLDVDPPAQCRRQAPI